MRFSEDEVGSEKYGWCQAMPNESLMRKYLLGDLPKEERTRIEDEYFTHAGRFEELVGVENDLIDSYVRGTLSDSERQQFEHHYANRPDRRARIDFATALSQVALRERDSTAAPKAPPWRSLQAYFKIPRPQLRWALVSAAVLLGGVLLGLQNYRLRRELQGAQANTNQLRLQQDTLRKQVEDLSAQRQHAPEGEQSGQLAQLEPPADLTFRLVPGVRGAVGEADLVIPPNRPWVRLEMVLERDEYKIYEAVLMPPEQSKEILRAKLLHSHSLGGSIVVSWRFRSDSIQSGDYIVRLTGEAATGKLENVESYRFRAVRK